jgi:3-hydroxymyristoyl/3-hydroxydecanoyl-(acyl carrier protein) dehydratase
LWEGQGEGDISHYHRKPALFNSEKILAFSNGNPSEAFGEPYRVFDHERIIARLPGPPYQFLDRITAVEGEQWVMEAEKIAEAQYDVPPDAWYFAANYDQQMPFSVLLEIVLQPCGWLAAYAGSALTSQIDLSFRNLGGKATQFFPVTPDIGTLTTVVKMTSVSTSGGMIIQHYEYELTTHSGDIVYQGTTYFGFFTKQALAHQIGIRDARPYQPTPEEIERGETFSYPKDAPFPASQLRMVDSIEVFVADGGPHGLGFIRGTKAVDPKEWFFQAHFYQDPVWPGSLGLESFLQLLKVVAVKRWGWHPDDQFETMVLNHPHHWTYRGQVIPSDHQVTIQAVITRVDDSHRFLEAAGFLLVDGRVIYHMENFMLRIISVPL